MTRSVNASSGAVILEGDNPAGCADLEVIVAPAPLAGETLYFLDTAGQQLTSTGYDSVCSERAGRRQTHARRLASLHD